MILNLPPSLAKSIELIKISRIEDTRGSLSFIESSSCIPFEIKRVYYLYDVPSGSSRGGHAHHNLEQLIIAGSGSFTIVLDSGLDRIEVQLDRPYNGLLIRSMIWRELKNFSSGSLCLVLASQHYDEKDYIRDYDLFLSHTLMPSLDKP